jgi:hypothetical protein
MRTLLPFLTFALVAMAGCNGGDTGQLSLGITTTVTAPVGAADVAPPDQLLMPVQQVSVHVVAAPTAAQPGSDDHPGSDDTADDDGAWDDVLTTPTTIDLLAPAATSAFLASAEVPAGRITQIRLIVGGDVSYVHDGAAATVACPSCAESGLKIVPRGTLELAAGAHLAVTLDLSATFDATRLRLDPVVMVASGG